MLQRSSSLAEMRPRWPKNDTENVAGHSSVEEAAAGSTSSFDTDPHHCCSLKRFKTEICSLQFFKSVSAGLQLLARFGKFTSFTGAYSLHFLKAALELLI